MAIFDNISKKISTTTQNVVRGTKDFTDIARLNSLISDEQMQIENLYAQIGKLYCESAKDDANSALGKLRLAVAASNDRIAKHNEEIREIKGSRRCPKCCADVPLSSAFCGVCGSKMEVDQPQGDPEHTKKFCTNCGTEVPEELVFCTSCGQKIE